MTTTPKQTDAIVLEMTKVSEWLLMPDYRSKIYSCSDGSLPDINTVPTSLFILVPMSLVHQIRAEALEEAAKVANEREEERVGIPCPDGIKGCAVFHFRRETRPRNHIEIIAAIKALKDKS